MKRLLTMLLSAALLVSAFAGCGGEGQGSSASSAANGEAAGSSSTSEASTGETDWSSQEPYTVKLLIPGDAKTEDVEEVSAAAVRSWRKSTTPPWRLCGWALAAIPTR